MTPYRAELSGITSVLFIIHWICTKASLKDGGLTIYCDNESAPSKTFKLGRPTNNPYKLLAADMDPITLSRGLLTN